LGYFIFDLDDMISATPLINRRGVVYTLKSTYASSVTMMVQREERSGLDSCTNHTLHEKDAAIHSRIHDLKYYPALLRNLEAKSKLTRGDVKQKVLLARTALEEGFR
jgi:hypothetical protein